MKKKNNVDIWLDRYEKNKKLLLGLLIGLGAGLLIMYLTEDPEIAKLKDGTEPVVKFDKNTITADDLYQDMKNYYSVNILINTMDTMILETKYKDKLSDINEQAQNRISEEKAYYGDQYLSLLQQSGFTSESQYHQVVKLDLLRNLEIDSYAQSLVKDNEVEDYYKDKVYGDMDTKHILVKPETNSDMTSDEKSAKEKEAENLAKEIISKLNSGKTFDEVKNEYKDKITYEELKYQKFNAGLEQPYLDEMLRLSKLENGKYSTTPVKTSYGYHIVYRIDMKEKAKLEDVKEDILTILATKLRENDSLIGNKALIKMRENSKLEFIDSVLKEKYEEYKTNALKVTE